MDHFVVSARKYRPATFQTVVGQQHITDTLKNAIRNKQLAQAFLFFGPRGVGKTTCARILAKVINCRNLTPDFEACGSCDSCSSFHQGTSFNVHELDAASNNSVDDIRNLIEQVRIPPQAGKYKVYIIDEVHMLSQAAFNAFLKTLEEPPNYAVFILATTEKHKILPTILSRCQLFDFNRIQVEDIVNYLAAIAQKEAIHFERDALHLIAQKADGGLRDALSIFDQLVSFSNNHLSYRMAIDHLHILDYDFYFKITKAFLEQDLAKALIIFDDILNHGFDGNHFIIGLASHFRNLLVCKDLATLKLLEVSDGIREKYQEQAQITSVSFLISALSISNQCDLNYEISKNQRLQVELSLIKMCHIAAAFNLSAAISSAEKKKSEQLNTDVDRIEKTYDLVKEVATIPLTEVAIAGQKKASEEGQLIPVEQKKYSSKKVLSKPVEILTEEGSTKSVPKIAGTLIPNLNDLFFQSLQVADQQSHYLVGSSKYAFHEKDLIKVWHQYANQKKEEGKINMFTLMMNHAPKLLDDHKIVVSVENGVQVDQLADEKIDLLNFLRVELQNFSIDIITKKIEQSETRRLYTASEKYAYMVEENPKLEEFRLKFDLSIEF